MTTKKNIISLFILQYNATARERQESQVHRIRSSSPMVGVPDATELDTARPQTAGNFFLPKKSLPRFNICRSNLH